MSTLRRSRRIAAAASAAGAAALSPLPTSLLDLLSDELLHVLHMLEDPADALCMRATSFGWYELLAQPSSLLGCKACASRTIDLAPQRILGRPEPEKVQMWAELLGSACTELCMKGFTVQHLDNVLNFESFLQQCPNLTQLTIDGGIQHERTAMLTTRRLLRTVVRAACAPRLKILKLCPGLSTANVWGPGLTSELCALAKACPLLEVVVVSRTDFDHEQLGLFPNLEEAQFWPDLLEQAHLEHISRCCPRLSTLDVNSTTLGWATDSTPFCAPLSTSLQTLVFTESSVAGLPALLQALPSLTSLDLWHSLEGAVQAAEVLNSCPKLRELKVGGSEIVDDDVVSAICAAQPALETLDISNTNVLTDAALFTIQQQLAATLHRLSLVYALKGLSAPAVLQLVEECQHLTTLKLNEEGGFEYYGDREFSLYPAQPHYVEIESVLQHRGGKLVDVEEEDQIGDDDEDSSDADETDDESSDESDEGESGSENGSEEDEMESGEGEESVSEEADE